MGLFKRKEKKPQLEKMLMVINRKNMAEFKCPYCNHILGECNPHRIDEDKPKIPFCPECGKEFIL